MDPRLASALHQNIFFVKLERKVTSFATLVIFHVLGTSNRVYQVTFTLNNPNNPPKCTCPDAKFHRNVCKHMHFVCEKVIGIHYQHWRHAGDIYNNVTRRMPHLVDNFIANQEVTKKYENILDNIKKNKNKQKTTLDIRNEECCICLGVFEKNTSSKTKSQQPLVCFLCNNAIHKECWKKWCQINESDRCVYCRTRIQKKVVVENSNDEYIIL